MSTGTTYFCTDSHGHTYSRYSASHIKPRYFWANIMRAEGTAKPVSKGNVSYSIKRGLPRAYPGYEAEIVPVRAYQGRHKVEPVAAEAKPEPAKTGSKTEQAVRDHALVESVSDERRMGDGIWAYLKPGWRREKCDYVHSVHEDTWTEVLKGLRTAYPCDCDDCKAQPEVEPVAKAETAPAKPWSAIEHVWTPCPTELAYGELRRAYEHFNAELFDGRLPRCLITFQRKGPRNLGYYSPDRFSGMIDASVKADEIALNPVNFAERGVADILSTLVHEMVHLQCQHEGKACRAGYHDKAWGAAMKAVGLYPSNTGAPGGRETGQQMMHYVIPGGPFCLSVQRLLKTGFTLSFADRHGMGEGKVKANPRQGKRSKYVCPSCKLAAWARPQARLVCWDCDEEMHEA